MKAILIDSNYDLKNGQTLVTLHGRLENGQTFSSFNALLPFFFIKLSDQKKAQKYLTNYEVTEAKEKTFLSEKCIKISHKNYLQLNKLSEVLHELEITTYEADIKPHTRFLIDNDLKLFVTIEGEWQPGERVDRIYTNPTLKPTEEYSANLKVLSIDTESDEQGNLFCIGLYSANYKKCFFITKEKLKDAVTCKDEAECLEKVQQEILKFDPDIITGWNMIDADMVYLQECYKKQKLPFDWSRTGEKPRIRISSNFFRASTCEVAGRQVLDGLALIKDPFIKEAPSIKFADFDSYTLEDVSQALIKKGKLLKGKGRHAEIIKLYKTDPQKIVDYNLRDCELVYDIIEHTKMLDLIIERSHLTGLHFDRLGGSIAAFDSLYIREAGKKNVVSPTAKYNQKEEKILGGYVLTPEPGIYHNVAVLDFKSLYPSIIRTFNIDPASFREHKEKGMIESPNKAYFTNTEGVLPGILTSLHHARERAKKEKRELASYAIKIIMNSFFGVLASPNSRYFNFTLGSAITNFAQMIIKLTAEEIKKKGYEIIYSDTDSVFVLTKQNEKEATAIAEQLVKFINAFYATYITKNYQRHSVLELETKRIYTGLLFPPLRMQKKDAEETKAAKKRYAGMYHQEGKEQLEIVGLEAVRGDWTTAAQEFQTELLTRLFTNKPYKTFIKDYIAAIRAGKKDELLIYRKSLRKDLTEYTKTTPPHVKAARLLDTPPTDVVEYYITTAGPEPLQKHTHPLDYDHYITKQIEPIANQALASFNLELKDIVTASKQSTL